MKRLLREPLTHFLILGAALFGIYRFVASPAAPSGQTIVVSSSIIQAMGSNFARTWHRQPTEAELDGLIQDYIRTEVLYRAGVEIGLDQDLAATGVTAVEWSERLARAIDGAVMVKIEDAGGDVRRIQIANSQHEGHEQHEGDFIK